MTRAACFFIVPLLAIFPLALGCQPQYGGDTNATLGVPEAGKVRVVTTQLETGTDKLHYKWSLIGGTNWRKTQVSNTDFSLSDTYAVNAVSERGGCNVFEFDLQADKATGKYKATLHGSDGSTARAEGSLPQGGVSDIHIAYDVASRTLGLPTSITFAQIGDKPLRLQVAR